MQFIKNSMQKLIKYSCSRLNFKQNLKTSLILLDVYCRVTKIIKHTSKFFLDVDNENPFLSVRIG